MHIYTSINDIVKLDLNCLTGCLVTQFDHRFDLLHISSNFSLTLLHNILSCLIDLSITKLIEE